MDFNLEMGNGIKISKYHVNTMKSFKEPCQYSSDGFITKLATF